MRFTHNPKHATDFRAFYTAGYLLRTEPSALYDTARQVQVEKSRISPSGRVVLYYHPSCEALLFAPFSLLPYRAAYLAYVAFGVLLLVATFFVLRPLFSTPIPYLQPWPGVMLPLFIPAAGALSWGQDSVLFLFLCCLAWRRLQSGKEISAGIVLALALFKFHLALPIAVLLAARRSWRFSAAFLASSLAVVLLSIALVGRAASMQFLHILSGAGLWHDQSHAAQNAIGLQPPVMSNLAGLLYVIGTRFLAPHAAFVVVLLVSIVLFVWTVVQIRRAPQDNIAFAMTILCAVLVSYHFLPYDLTLLLLPIALLPGWVHPLVLLALYWMPIVLYVTLGAHFMFLLAVPLLALLAYVGLSRDKTKQ